MTEKDLLDNPTTRVPVVLCLDVSASMTIDGRIEQLNKGVQEFFRSVSEDKIAKWAAEICIVIFNNEAKKLRRHKNEYVSLEEIGDSFTYEADHGSLEFFDILSSARLDDKSGRIVMLRFFYGYTLEEISKITNTPLSNVTSKYYRALEKIRKTIK